MKQLPSISKTLKVGWDISTSNIVLFIVLFLVACVFNLPDTILSSLIKGEIVSRNSAPIELLSFLVAVFTKFVSIVSLLVSTKVALDLVDGKTVKVGDISNYVKKAVSSVIPYIFKSFKACLIIFV